jgi:murein endopeptidase
MLSTLLLLGLAIAAPPVPSDAWMEQDEPPVPIELAPRERKRCSKYWLFRGAQLPAAPDLYKRWRPDRAYGTPEMLEVLQTAAEELAWLMPEADPLFVGDISKRSGGHLDGHRSHKGGLDADVGLFWKGGRMVLGGSGAAAARSIDPEANWYLIRSMLDTGLVERILLDQRIVNTLRRWTVENGELTQEEANRIFWRNMSNTEVWSLDGVVHHHPGHANHMHVRVKCPE